LAGPAKRESPVTPFQKRYVERSGLGDLQEKVLARERLSRDEGLRL